MTEIFDDKHYMQLALQEAKKAYNNDEVPIGAVLVDEQGLIIVATSNSGEHGENALEHAEIKALTMGAKILQQTRLWQCSLYVTLEPCPMCAAAISQMRIKKLIFGAQNTKGGAVLNGVRFYESKTCNHKPIVISGILEQECSEMLSEFFRLKRKSKI